MVVDQLEVDPARVKPGGACLTCKSPYAGRLLEQYGSSFLRLPYSEAVERIPAEHRTLGLACIDCHTHESMDLAVSRWTILNGLAPLGKDRPTRQGDAQHRLLAVPLHVRHNQGRGNEAHGRGFPLGRQPLGRYLRGKHH
ncbi:MAG: ammonia-forming cytochrome c nitrite reductase subunit c552 [Firmicutes bacterium]|nr:ammonia-forming cytochrome c nitrite reductase subunit c552 [Bacillota bacterium]